MVRKKLCVCFVKNQALLDHAKFHDADLRECNFKGAKVAECHFTKADLRGATMDWDWVQVAGN